MAFRAAGAPWHSSRVNAEPGGGPTGAGILLAVAREAAGAAREVLLSRFRRPATGVATKSSPTDLVSDADRLAEAAIREVLAHRRPGDAILGEEGGEAPRSSDGGDTAVRWVVDPLDGTVNYLYGLPMWAISICAEVDGTGLAGVVEQPCTGEVYAAALGGGATLDGAAIAVSEVDELELALVATGFAYTSELRAAQAAVVARLLPRVRDIRRGGSAALDLAAIAAGRIDAYYETGLGVWDVAAGRLLVTEAGGAVGHLHSPLPRTVGLVAGPAALVDGLMAEVSAT